MPTSTSLQLMTPAQRPVVDRLWQLYQHDMSEFRGSVPNDQGLYKAGRLPLFFNDPDRCGYLVRHDGALVGFALVRGLCADARVMGEFFIVRAARRRRAGHQAALELFRLHPGHWEIPFQEENPGAARFWRRVAAQVAGDAVKEERRPVPDKPEIPPDTWLLLTT